MKTFRISKKLGEKIRTEREESGLTQARVAEASGLSPSYIVKIEQGNCDVSRDALQGIMFALGVDRKWFGLKEFVEPTAMEKLQAAMQKQRLKTEELKLVELWRQLSPSRKKDLVKVLRGFLLQEEFNPNADYSNLLIAPSKYTEDN